jgi:hypothetical protein
MSDSDSIVLVTEQVQGPPGPTGPKGDTGDPGGPGLTAYTSTTASFVQPAIDALITVHVVSTATMAALLPYAVNGGGFYIVYNILSSTQVQLSLKSIPTGSAQPGDTVASGALVIVAAAPGAGGGSSDTLTGTGTTTGAQTSTLLTYPVPDDSVIDVSASFVAGDPAQPTKTWRQTRTITLARTGGGAPVTDVGDAGGTAAGTLTGASASLAVSGNDLIARGSGSVGGRTLNFRVALLPLVIAVTPSGGGGPTPALSFYGDVPASITATGELITVWSVATSIAGTPRVVTDSVDGGNVIRTTTANKLLTPGGAAAFLNSGPCTMAFVWRYRSITTSTLVTLLDTTEGGTKAGIQVQIGDEGNNIFYGRSISVRQWDGSSWVFDSLSIAGAIMSGVFIPFKNQTIVVRLSDTHCDVMVDGQSAKVGGWTISPARSYAAGTTGKLQIGGAAGDYKAVELYDSYLSDSDVAALNTRLSARFGTKPSVLLEGDPLYADPTQSAGFPWVSKLPGGKLYATVTNTSESIGPQHSDHSDAFLSSDGGLTWSGPTVINTSATTLYSDLKTSEPLADGSLIQVTMTYDVSLAFVNVVWRRATTFNVDGSPIWPGTWNAITTGTPTWSATQCAPVEDPTTPGTLHMAVWTKEGSSDTFYSVWDYITTNAGATWTRNRIANGMTDSKKYVEPGFDFEGSELRTLIRDDTSGSLPMLASHSTDHGVTWAAPVTVNLPGHSSGQQVRKLASGRRVVLIRRIGSSVKGGIFYQDPGSAWNTAWSSSILEFEPVFGGFYYGGLYEATPGNMCLVAARTTTGIVLNVAALQLSEWMIVTPQAMPGTVTPTTVSLTINTTQQLTVMGAGDYTYAVTTNNSGGSVSSSGIITAGPGNGVDTITVTDLNGHIVGTCTSTVSGATSVPTVTSILPDFGTASGGTSFTLTGTNLTGATVVSIGGVNVTSFTVVNSTTITGTTAAVAASANNTLSVTTPGGTGTKANAFAYLPAGFAFGFSGDVGMTLSGSNITAWADQSGNGRTLSPPSFLPALVSSGINGQKSVRFVGGGDTLTFASFPTLTGLDLFAVCQNADDTTQVSPFCFTDDTQANLFPLASNRQLYDGSGSTTRQTTGFAPASGKWALPWSYNSIATASEWTASFNGTQIYTQASNTVGYGTHRVGKGVISDYIGMIAFLFAWPSKLSTGDRAVVNAYIHTKYGI